MCSYFFSAKFNYFWNHIFIFLFPALFSSVPGYFEHPYYRADLFAFWLAGVALMAVADYSTNLSMLNERRSCFLANEVLWSLFCIPSTIDDAPGGFFERPAEARSALKRNSPQRNREFLTEIKDSIGEDRVSGSRCSGWISM